MVHGTWYMYGLKAKLDISDLAWQHTKGQNQDLILLIHCKKSGVYSTPNMLHTIGVILQMVCSAHLFSSWCDIHTTYCSVVTSIVCATH